MQRKAPSLASSSSLHVSSNGNSSSNNNNSKSKSKINATSSSTNNLNNSKSSVPISTKRSNISNTYSNSTSNNINSKSHIDVDSEEEYSNGHSAQLSGEGSSRDSIIRVQLGKKPSATVNTNQHTNAVISAVGSKSLNKKHYLSEEDSIPMHVSSSQFQQNTQNSGLTLADLPEAERTKVARLVERLVSLGRENEELTAEVSGLRARLASEVEDATARAIRAESQLTELSSSLAESEEKCGEYKGLLEVYQVKLEASLVAIEKLEKLSSKGATSEEALAMERNRYENLVNSLEEEIQRLGRLVESQQQLLATKEALSASLASHKENIESLESRLEDNQKYCSELENKVKGLESELQEAKSIATQAQASAAAAIAATAAAPSIGTSSNQHTELKRSPIREAGVLVSMAAALNVNEIKRALPKALGTASKQRDSVDENSGSGKLWLPKERDLFRASVESFFSNYSNGSRQSSKAGSDGSSSMGQYGRSLVKSAEKTKSLPSTPTRPTMSQSVEGLDVVKSKTSTPARMSSSTSKSSSSAVKSQFPAKHSPKSTPKTKAKSALDPTAAANSAIKRINKRLTSSGEVKEIKPLKSRGSTESLSGAEGRAGVVTELSASEKSLTNAFLAPKVDDSSSDEDLIGQGNGQEQFISSKFQGYYDASSDDEMELPPIVDVQEESEGDENSEEHESSISRSEAAHLLVEPSLIHKEEVNVSTAMPEDSQKAPQFGLTSFPADSIEPQQSRPNVRDSVDSYGSLLSNEMGSISKYYSIREALGAPAEIMNVNKDNSHKHQSRYSEDSSTISTKKPVVQIPRVSTRMVANAETNTTPMKGGLRHDHSSAVVLDSLSLIEMDNSQIQSVTIATVDSSTCTEKDNKLKRALKTQVKPTKTSVTSINHVNHLYPKKLSESIIVESSKPIHTRAVNSLAHSTKTSSVSTIPSNLKSPTTNSSSITQNNTYIKSSPSSGHKSMKQQSRYRTEDYDEHLINLLDELNCM